MHACMHTCIHTYIHTYIHLERVGEGPHRRRARAGRDVRLPAQLGPQSIILINSSDLCEL